MTHGDEQREVAQTLRVDTKGRVHSTAEQRAKILEAYERSGLSAPRFAKVAGVPYQTLVTWRKRHRARLPVTRLRFVQAVNAAEAESVSVPLSVGLRIDLPGGA